MKTHTSKSADHATPAAQPFIQPKLEINKPEDAYELEADNMADRVMRMSDGGLSQPSIQRKCNACREEEDEREGHASVMRSATTGGGQSASPWLTSKLSDTKGSGNPMPDTTRSFMEQAFNRDFASVRIHDNDSAAAMNRDVQAKAFTHGRDIYFNNGQYAPDTQDGKRLLAHELTHVVQQGQGGPQSLQRQVHGTSERTGVTFFFSVEVHEVITSDMLLREFVRQYRRLESEEAITEEISTRHWRWSDETPVVSQADADRGYKLLRVTDRSLRPATAEETAERDRYFRGLSAGDRAALNAATDRQFWDRTHYREGETLGRTTDDRRMSEYWRVLRDELIRQRIAIDNLPREIRDFIFNEGGEPLQPGNYDAVLRVAQKLMEMTPEEREGYLARTTASTTNLSEFEAALDRYRTELQQRAAAIQDRENTKTALTGLDEVYRQYRLLKSLETSSAASAAMGMGAAMSGAGLGLGGGGLVVQGTINDLRAELTANLQRFHYNSIGDFEMAILRFELAFQTESFLIAREMLDRYEHVLWEQEAHYQEPGAGSALYRQLAPARGHYEAASRARTDRMFESMSRDEMDLGRAEHLTEMTRLNERVTTETAAGAAAVSGLSGEHPLLGNRDIEAEDLATTPESEVQGRMLSYIRERRTDVQNTRRNLEEHPTMIWDLELLVQRAKLEMDISPDTIYDMIIEDHIRDANLERTLITLGVTVLALAAGLASMGTGTVAVLGASAAFGISAYQAWEEFRRYEVDHAATGAQLTARDPSFAWVVVAMIGAGLDLAGVASAMRGPLRASVQAFNETGDIAQLEAQIANAGLSDAMRQNVMAAARAEVESRAAWSAARSRFYGRAMAVIDPIVTPLLNLAVNFAYPVYLSLRRGIISFRGFLLSREAASMLGDVAHLRPEQLTAIREAYQIAMRNAQTLAAHGNSLGMLDSEIERFLLMWNQHPNLSVTEMMEQMTQWAAPLAGRAGARARIAPDMIMDASSRRLLGDYGQQIAGTGGIESISATVPRVGEGSLSVTIEGEVLPQRLARRPAVVTPTRRRAPDFNRSGSLFTATEAGLTRDWQRLHLWGPGFGDEAAAGMMWGPRSVNLVWQNDSIESYIRQLAELSRRHGGRTRVRATAIAWEFPTPGGFVPPHGDQFLRRAQYEITLIRPGMGEDTIRITLDVAPPPATTIQDFDISPASAANLGDLFP